MKGRELGGHARRESLYDRALKAWPWLFVTGGYVLGIIAIFGMWDPAPHRPPEADLFWEWALLIWIVFYPTAIYGLWTSAWHKGHDEGLDKPHLEDPDLDE